MSFVSDYLELRNKRKKKKGGTATNTSQKTFEDEYLELRGNKEVDTEDIAPVKTTTQKSDERKWFQKGAFEDGYQFGDILKTIGGTITDVAENTVEWVGDKAEKLWDGGLILGAMMNRGQMNQAAESEMLYNFVSGKKDENVLQRYQEYQDKVEKGTLDYVGKDVIDQEKIAKSIIDPVERTIRVDTEGADSVLGDKSDALLQSGVDVLVRQGISKIPVVGTGLAYLISGTSILGGEAENAARNGATFNEAVLSGMVSAGAELGSEALFGGIKIGGKTATDFISNLIASRIANKTLGTLAKWGFNTAGEGIEEVLSGVGSAIGQKMTYAKEKEFTELFSSEDAWDNFLSGAILGGAFEGAHIIGAKKHGIDYVSGLTNNEKAVVDKVYENTVAEREADGKKLTQKEKSEIYDSVISDMGKGYISIDTIEEVLGGETYKTYKSTLDSEEALQKEFNTLNRMKQGEMTGEQLDRRAELKQQLAELKEKSNKDILKSQLYDEVFGLAKDSKLAESYNEKSRRGQAFEADLSKYDTKQAEVVKKAVDSGILNNTNRTHEFVDMIAKISADKGVSFDFINNKKLKESGFAIEGKTVNGYVTKDGIALNIDSAKALNSVAGHEITHVLEGTELYNVLEETITEYAKAKGEYDSRLETLTKLYSNVEGVDINKELVADLVGDYLFTDSDFIKKLSTEHRNVFQKIFDEIKYLCKITTAGSKEARQLEKVKKVFQDVYRESGKAQKNTAESGEIRYSLMNDATFEENAKNIINMTDEVAIKNKEQGNFIRVMDNTPSVILENVKNAGDYEVIIRFDALYLATRKDGALEGHYHNLGKDIITKLPEFIENPDAIVRMNNGRLNIFTTIETPKGNNGIISMEMNTVKDINSKYNKYNLVVSVFSAKDSYTKNNLSKNGVEVEYKKEDLSQVNPQLYEWLAIFNDKSSNVSIPNPDENVKKNSLSEDDTKPTKYGNYNVSGEDVRLGTAQEDIAPIREDIQKTKVIDDIGPIREDVPKAKTVENIGPVREIIADNDIAPLLHNDADRISSLDEADAQSETAVEDTEDVSENEIKTVKDRLRQKLKNYEAERESLIAKAKKTSDELDNKIAAAQAQYDSKKNKDTKIANALFRRIEQLGTRKGNINADYAKRINDIDTRIQNINEDLQKDHTRIEQIEKAINRIDKILEIDKEALNEEFEQRRTQFADKNIFIGRKARELYGEISNLKKGVRASEQLGYFLDLGYDFKSLKSAFAHIDMSPSKTVNSNSEAEATVRIELNAMYEEDLAAFNREYRERLNQLETEAENKRKAARTANQRRTKQDEYTAQMEELVGDTSTWKDKKTGLGYEVNTLHRILRDVVRDENGNRDIAKSDAIYEYLQGEYNQHEAELKRENARIKKVFADMKITKAESAYIQMLGEFRHNPNTTVTEDAVKEFYEKHKKKIDKKKVDKAISLARGTYDELIKRVNEVLKEQGMKEIPYREGYFPHFVEPKQNFIARLLNWKAHNDEIPTDIAGLTEEYKPERSWQSFNKERKSDITDYNFLKGMDNYVQGALDWIYHIEDIQKRRSFENYIRYVHSESGVQEKIEAIRNNEEYDADEAQAQIDLVLNEASNPLNNFVVDFKTGTNILAGKKNSLDRVSEQKTGRRIYSVMTNVQNRLSANMVLANVRSALTNFIPITQSWSQVSPVRSLQATKDTIKSAIANDGIVDKSTFLTNRLKNPDNLYKTNWDKIMDGAGVMFEVVDNFSSQVIWRSKYIDNIKKGMSESEAIKNADQFAENVLAGRSRGNMPTLFTSNSPLAKVFTVFQLEVNNQYGYLFKDVPQDLKTEKNHWKLNLAKGYATAFIGAYVYNELLSKVAGSGAALDPISIIKDLLRDLGLFDDDEEEKDPTKAVVNLTENVLQELPFISGLVGGGRIPLSNALPYSDEDVLGGLEAFAKDANNTIKAVAQTLKGDGNKADWSGAKNIGKEMMNPILNVGLPVGGGQIKKTVQGLSMFNTDDEHPVAGSYTDSGALRFPVDDTIGNRIQAGIFGRWANKNARDYIEQGRKPLQEKQIQEFIDVDLPIADYWKYREGLSGLETLDEKGDYIGGLDLPISKKNILINNIADRKEQIDLTDYDKYSNFEEFDFATKNPKKYEFLNQQGISVKEYNNFDQDTKEAYSWAVNNPEKYTVSKAVTDNVVKYKQYTKALSEISADKDAEGKSISGSRKEKVIDYVNGLDIEYGEKIILFKSQYTSDDTYNYEIVDYLNSRDDISYQEMETILKELGFTVLSDGTVKW